MDDIQIARGGEGKRLLLFTGMVLGVFVVVDLLWVMLWSRVKAAHEPNASPQEGFLELASVAFVVGVFFSLPAFFFMAIFKRLRCIHYFGGVVGIGIAGAVISALVGYNIRMNPGPEPFPRRTPVFADTLGAAVLGFNLGLVGGSCLAPCALFLRRRQALLPAFGNDEESSISVPEPLEGAPADDTAIRKT
jgi:hypothetical protein